jgi:hypothetical protein
VRPSVVLLVGLGLLYLLYKGRLDATLGAIGGGGSAGSGSAAMPSAPVPENREAAAKCPPGMFYATAMGRCVPLGHAGV